MRVIHYRKDLTSYKKKFGYICMLCFEIGNENHHIVPLAQGGLGNENNIILLCYKCHQKVGIHSHFQDTEMFLAIKKHYFEARYLEEGRFWEKQPEFVPTVQEVKLEEEPKVKIFKNSKMENIKNKIKIKKKRPFGRNSLWKEEIRIPGISLKRAHTLNQNNICFCGRLPLIYYYGRGSMRIRCKCGLKTRTNFMWQAVFREWHKITKRNE